MLKGTISIEGKTTSDNEYAVTEALRLIREGFTSGSNSNETGSFNFDLEGQEDDAHLLCPECGWSCTKEEAKEKELEEDSECPECAHRLDLVGED